MKSKVGSLFGMTEEDGNSTCPFLLKKSGKSLLEHFCCPHWGLINILIYLENFFNLNLTTEDKIFRIKNILLII